MNFKKTIDKVKNTRVGQIVFYKKYNALSGKSLSELFKVFWRSITDGNITTRAASIAYNLFLSIFPAIIFLFTLIPYLPIPNLDKQVMNLLRELMPNYSYKTFETLILDIVSHQRGGLLSFSALTTLYFATNGFNSFLSAFQESIFFNVRENWFRKRLHSLFLAVILTVLIAIATLLTIFTDVAVNALIEYDLLADNYVVWLIMIGKWIIVFLLFYFTISFMYYYGTPKRANRRWKIFSVGATFSTIMVLLVSWGFSYYVSNFGHYNKFYGSLGAIIVLLLWLYFMSLVILIGFEINKSIDAEGKVL